MAHAGGRPTDLNDEIIKIATLFVLERSNISSGSLLPTIEGLALALHITRETIYDWETKGEASDANDLQKEFSDIVKELRHAQAEKLMQNSLAGRYNPMISKLLLSKHGYVEKSETDITSKGDKVSQPVDATLMSQFLMNVQDNTKR